MQATIAIIFGRFDRGTDLLKGGGGMYLATYVSTIVWLEP